MEYKTKIGKKSKMKTQNGYFLKTYTLIIINQ